MAGTGSVEHTGQGQNNLHCTKSIIFTGSVLERNKRHLKNSGEGKKKKNRKRRKGREKSQQSPVCCTRLLSLPSAGGSGSLLLLPRAFVWLLPSLAGGVSASPQPALVAPRFPWGAASGVSPRAASALHPPVPAAEAPTNPRAPRRAQSWAALHRE